MQRRKFLAATISGTTGLLVSSTIARAIPSGIGLRSAAELPTNSEGRVLSLDQLEEAVTNQVGTESPYPDEIRLARSILDRAPANVSAFDIALYFHYIRLGTYGDISYEYAMEWPERANPVIVGFFEKTNFGRPSGDVTPWCAAFVNWCIARSNGGSSATNSAASRSFRTYSEETFCPQMGDIVVFKRRGDDYRGHVGFYVGHRTEENGRLKSIFVLGGNQAPNNRINGGEVNVSEFSANGRTLQFHSFRSMSGRSCG